MSVDPAFNDETMLMAWGESDTQGPWIKLRLPSTESLSPFRGMTRAKGDKAGQRLAVVIVEINDQEEPVQTKPKTGPVCLLAVQWCKEPAFQDWVIETWGAIADGTFVEDDREAFAKAIILWACGIESRRELDEKPHAAELFHSRIRIPYLGES